MKVSVLTVFPNLYSPFLTTSLLKKAQEREMLEFDLVSFFSCVSPKERIDAPTFGHNAGMLIRPDVMECAITRQEEKYGRALRIFFSPQGKKLDQELLRLLSKTVQQKKHLMLIASRYEGIDQRVEDVYADETISVGDFVVMGGDLPAMLFLEGLVRLLPGVVGNQESVAYDSFSGPFVDHPEYTAPAVWKEVGVPEVVRSGNHQEIERWRRKEAVQRSIAHHFEWVKGHCVAQEDRELVREYLPPHYVVLMHSDVLLPSGLAGTTSVTSFDLHDVSRSCRTFGIEKYFIVTPLLDQQAIVKTLLDFWQTGVGIDYNKKRHEAVKIVQLLSTLDEVIEAIEEKHDKKPVLIGTSARSIKGVTPITYNDHAKVWNEKRPVLFVFGTAKGLTQELLERCDFMLGPIAGFSDFNHLSVRAAVSIVLDRWMGINLKKVAQHEE